MARTCQTAFALVACVWFAGAAEARAAPVLTSGSLTADVEADPWHLELADKRGRVVLAEHHGTGSGPTGTLGFRALGGWRHATRVISSSSSPGRFRARLATTSPAHELVLELRAAGSGVIALNARLDGPALGVEAMGMGFEAPPKERYLGFGERSNAVDQTGGAVESYVADGPYQAEEYPFLAAFVPPWGLRDGRPDATYFPIPWLLSSAGYGVLVDNPQTSLHRLRSANAGAWSVEVQNAPSGELGAELAPPVDRLQLRFFAGPRPADALRRLTAAVGRQPRAAAPWVYGPWYQAGDPVEELAALRAADAPVSVLQTYTHYLPCGDQETAAERARVAEAHRAGVAITTYFNPMVCTNYAAAYAPARSAGALTTNALGEPYVYRYGADVDDLFVVSQYDFYKPEGRSQFAARLGEAIADGYDGWMEDFGEYTPLDSVSGDGIDGARAHNEYARRYHCAAWDAVREQPRPIVRYQRSGWTGSARCAQVVWGGDPTTGWDFDGLRSALTQALSAGLSGVGIWGSDIGGFFALGQNELSPELLKRWVQFGAVSGVMRTQRNGVAVPPRDRPQVSDPDQIANWRRYAKLHTQLYPYLLAAQEDYRRLGLPLMRHLLLHYPTDARAAAADDEFLLGPDLLAAPVLTPGATEREVYLPPGRWVDLWRSARYMQRSGGLRLAKTNVRRGGSVATLPAPLDELPLLVRAGAVLPLLPPGVDTLAPFGAEAKGITALAERRRRLRLLAFPRGRSRSEFGDAGVLISRARPDMWRLKVRAPKRHRFRLQAALSTLRRPLEPCGVTLDGRVLPASRWSYRAKSRVLRARFAARRGTFEVSSRC